MKPKKFRIECQTNLGAAVVGQKPVEIFGPDVFTNHAGVDKCLDFIARSFCKPIQVADLAEVAGMSRRGFFKAFTKGVGANPGIVLRRVRIEYAKRLLVEHDFSLKQIARQCGFRSENTFCIAFQRALGMPPKKYQRQYLLAVCRGQRQGKIQPLIASRLWSGILEPHHR